MPYNLVKTHLKGTSVKIHVNRIFIVYCYFYFKTQGNW